MADIARIPAPRLNVLLASNAPVGVILRRGPSKLVRLIVWNRTTDKFRLGAWFKGRIFADRSDVSPDGHHFLYFAMGGVAWAIPQTRGTWTAISKLPSLKAAALWGQGDTWGGGGMFLSDKSFWLDAGSTTFLIRDDSGLRRETEASRLRFRSRLERDGWVQRSVTVFEKKINKGWILRQACGKRGYELEHPGECLMKLPHWDWADQDGSRLVWTERGCLLAARPGAHKLGTVQTLYDFNSMTPPIAAY